MKMPSTAPVASGGSATSEDGAASEVVAEGCSADVDMCVRVSVRARAGGAAARPE
jgi:hypothetical protein